MFVHHQRYSEGLKKDLPINEKNKFHPASPYTISKIGTDFIAKYYYEAFQLKILTTRMFTHTGPRRGLFCRVKFC